MEYWEKWLEYAENDLKASRLLYDNKDYRNAIYHLQQSEEKLSKAFLAKNTSIMTDKTAITFGHAWHEVLAKLVLGLNIYSKIDLNQPSKEFLELNSRKTDPNPSNEEVVELCSEISKKINDIDNPSPELQKALNESGDKYKDTFSIPAIENELKHVNDNPTFKHFIPGKLNDNIIKEKLKEYESNKGDISEYVNKMIPKFLFLIPMMMLSSLLVSHEKYARYPSEIDYEKHAIKTNYEKVYYILETLINNVKKS